MKTTLQKGRTYVVIVPIPAGNELKKDKELRDDLQNCLGIKISTLITLPGGSFVQFVESNGNEEGRAERSRGTRCAGVFNDTGGNKKRCGRKTTHESGYCPFHRYSTVRPKILTKEQSDAFRKTVGFEVVE